MVSDFTTVGLPLDIILWVVFLVTLLIFAGYSAILLWHWKEYSTGKFTTVTNMIVYLSVGGGCLGVMALAALWYTL